MQFSLMFSLTSFIFPYSALRNSLDVLLIGRMEAETPDGLENASYDKATPRSLSKDCGAFHRYTIIMR